MRLLFIGAHPDDPDYRAGGTAKLYSQAGHQVRFFSMTNGDMGHQEMRGPMLVERRKRECFMASGVGGLEYVVHNHRDGRLMPTLEAREDLIGMIRQFNPDVIFTHRQNDYHPDHRYTSLLVQDASYMLTVPGICPRVPHLRRMPVICYMEDEFLKPNPMRPELVIAIDEMIDDKVRMLACHVSQFFEWLPYNQGLEREVPGDPEERVRWLGALIKEMAGKSAERFRDRLVQLYGPEKGRAVKYAEAFEICEYGRQPKQGELETLFPFFEGR